MLAQELPAGDLIAFYVGQIYAGYSDELHLIRLDGSGERRITSRSFAAVFDWSPDGRYIVTERADYGGLAIIEVATGVTCLVRSKSVVPNEYCDC